ncbi:Fe(2+) transporter permease subunit FeoB [Aliikangiella sp. G2MR2-5]|uniref:Fe(2+) transporter permease subunit FeoB n=1 Tax=Aliikangiella sp. G2MR2-5 TaxID=2788943 RepID=UPI0018AA18C7|nr:Fe(2+) transporter permease subunit FeoB [Aliikangiella sp. G2MR2-5]
MSKSATIALCGNPNCGKTTLFNLLTGARQEVGNWPGVTVEKKSGSFQFAGENYTIVDLPGTYSLDVVDESVALDEKVARDYILSEDAGLIVNIIDASNIERNLYLTTQLLEVGKPVLVVLNMMDVAKKQKTQIDVEELQNLLGCPIIPFTASKTRKPYEIKEKLVSLLEKPEHLVDFELEFDEPLSTVYHKLTEILVPYAEEQGVRAKWLALRLLEDNSIKLPGQLSEQVGKIAKPLSAAYGEDLDIAIADARFNKILSWIDSCVSKNGEVSRSISAKLDKVFLNKFLGIPLFLAVTYLMFVFTINFGGAFIDFFDQATGAVLVDAGGEWLTSLGLPAWLVTILANGIGGGIQVVSTFIPIIATLYLFLAVLEDTGYLARGAFVMDRFMQSIGLPGKSFIPLMVGLGCTVPAIYATRSLEYQKDRIMTVMMSPFISCGARLPVYILFAAAFFPENAQNLVFAIYLTGIAVAILTGLLLKHTLLVGENTPFVMELPAYHLPNLRNVLIKTWEKLSSFILGAGKLIVIVVMVLSFFNSLGSDGSFGNENTEKSVLSNIGKTITPVFAPMGIKEDNWPATVGIFTGVFAKEVVVGTIDSLYSIQLQGDEEEASLSLSDKLYAAWQTVPDNLSEIPNTWSDPVGIGEADVKSLDEVAQSQEIHRGLFELLQSSFDGTLGAFSFLLFILLYSPCVSALGATMKETGSRWTLFIVLWSTFLAYSLSTIVYQAGQLMKTPVSASLWIGFFITLHLLNIYMLKSFGRKRILSQPEPARV